MVGQLLIRRLDELKEGVRKAIGSDHVNYVAIVIVVS